MSTCFLVYPLPSIADEGFLRAVFQDKLGRALFAGFGPRRFAIAELSDADFAQRVAAALQSPPVPSSCTAAAQDNDGAAQEGGAEEEDKATDKEANTRKAARKTAKKPRSAAKVQDWLSSIPAEEMTLATLFAPPIEESARLRPILADPTGTSQPVETTDDAHNNNNNSEEAAVVAAEETGAMNSALASLSYLHSLVWRGRPVRVVCSPVTVEEFYGSGGVVPEKQNKPARGAKKEGHDPTRGAVQARGEEEGKDDNGGERQQPQQQQADPTQYTKEGADDGHSARKRSRTEAVAAPAQHHKSREHARHGSEGGAQVSAGHAPRSAFPKDCCQKCGSKAHFTRHCDGSGFAAHETSKVKQQEVEEVKDVMAPVVKREKVAKVERLVAPVAAPAAVKPAPPKLVVRTSKDQCKYCGSNEHLSRHCPNK